VVETASMPQAVDLNGMPNNVFDFVQFKSELREVIQLLRA
jgi:hypothetical protein